MISDLIHLSSGYILVLIVILLKHTFAKECSNCCVSVLISHASKVMLKILQARPQQDMNEDFKMFKWYLEKAEEPEIKLPTFVGSWKKQGNSRKKHLLLLHWLC